MALLDSWVSAKKTLASTDALTWYRKWGLYIVVGLGTLLIVVLVVRQGQRKDALVRNIRRSVQRKAELRLQSDNAVDAKRVKALRKEYVAENGKLARLEDERDRLARERAAVEAVIFQKKTVEELDAVLESLK